MLGFLVKISTLPEDPPPDKGGYRGIAPHFDVHRKVGPHVERRIDVDELQAALRLEFLAQRPVLQRRQDQFVVAPDEFIRPPLELPAAGIRREERQLLSP